MANSIAHPLDRAAVGNPLIKVVRIAAWLAALAIVAGTFVFAWQGTLSVISADAWWFTDNFLRRYFDGQLQPLDLFVKRGGIDHSQPIQKLLLLAYARWFDLDFRIEAMAGLVFDAAFVVFAWLLVRRDLGESSRGTPIGSLCLLGLAAAMFSLNERGVYDWSLVTMTLMYPLGIALLLAFVWNCLEMDSPVRLFVGVFIAAALLDTVAILCSAGIAALILFRSWQTGRWRVALRALVAMFAALIAYLLLYSHLLPLPGGDAAQPKLAYLLEHAREAWKAIAIPAGSVLFSANRIAETKGAAAIWRWMIPSALLICVGHVLFWWGFLRNSARRSAFVAAGLMLYVYAAIAGIVWGRVALSGFDYLMQPRYLAIFELQWVSFVIVGALEAGNARTGGAVMQRALYATLTIGLACLSLYFLSCSWTVVPYMQDFDRKLAEQTERLAQNPEQTPDGCLVHHLVLCEWPADKRAAALELLRREHLNVFSARFRDHLALPPPGSQALPAR